MVSFLSYAKHASVSPLYKKDDPSLECNYRPISSIGKVMEKIVLVHKHMFNHFNDHSIIRCLQSGFIPRDSIVNQSVDIYNTYNTFCQL